MATIEVIVCDVCHDTTRDTEHFTVMSGQDSWDLDLCEEHAVPLRPGLLKEAASPVSPPPPPSRRRGRPSRFDSAVATIDEIEAHKRKRG